MSKPTIKSIDNFLRVILTFPGVTHYNHKVIQSAIATAMICDLILLVNEHKLRLQQPVL